MNSHIKELVSGKANHELNKRDTEIGEFLEWDLKTEMFY